MIKRKSKEQKRIDSRIAQHKKWYMENEPWCIFCLQPFRPGQIIDPVHKVRRSETVECYTRFELQTMKLNIGLAHRECHRVFDDNPEKAVELPGFNQVINDIRAISQQTYDRLMNLLYNQNK